MFDINKSYTRSSFSVSLLFGLLFVLGTPAYTTRGIKHQASFLMICPITFFCRGFLIMYNTDATTAALLLHLFSPLLLRWRLLLPASEGFLVHLRSLTRRHRRPGPRRGGRSRVRCAARSSVERRRHCLPAAKRCRTPLHSSTTTLPPR